VQELGPDRISFRSGSSPIDLIQPVKSEDPAEYQRLIEGAWVLKRDGWYYMFYSGDNCCGSEGALCDPDRALAQRDRAVRDAGCCDRFAQQRHT
jgi:hypothetical protein